MLKLVKTVGGADGAPTQCEKCGSNHFARSGIAWHCTACGIYHPTKLGFESLKESLKRLNDLSNQMKFVRQDLEELTRE